MLNSDWMFTFQPGYVHYFAFLLLLYVSVLCQSLSQLLFVSLYLHHYNVSSFSKFLTSLLHGVSCDSVSKYRVVSMYHIEGNFRSFTDGI